jgi:hypothetical protein
LTNAQNTSRLDAELFAEEPMAKKAKSKARSKRVATVKGTSKRKAFEAHPEDHIDGCACEFIDSEATPDAALPPATGGVEKQRRAHRGSRM